MLILQNYFGLFFNSYQINHTNSACALCNFFVFICHELQLKVWETLLFNESRTANNLIWFDLFNQNIALFFKSCECWYLKILPSYKLSFDLVRHLSCLCGQHNFAIFLRQLMFKCNQGLHNWIWIGKDKKGFCALISIE